MPKAKRYSDGNALIAALRQCGWHDRFVSARLEKRDCDLATITRESVGRNTFRAFHHQPKKPGETFRAWAQEAISEARVASLRRVGSHPEYSRWLYGLSDHFRAFWRDQMLGNDISYGPSLKLPNLVMRHVCLYKGLSDELVEKLVWYLHVPLDSFTIQAVAQCVDLFPNKEAIGKIPASATMSFIKNREMYEAFQEGIRQMAAEVGVPPITLDYVAWDSSH
jgi:hypothetical protein